MTNSFPKWGTAEYYQTQFEDILCEVGDTETDLDNVVEGFVSALRSFSDYYANALARQSIFRAKLVDRLQ